MEGVNKFLARCKPYFLVIRKVFRLLFKSCFAVSFVLTTSTEMEPEVNKKSIWKRLGIYGIVILAILSCQLPTNLLGGGSETEPEVAQLEVTEPEVVIDLPTQPLPTPTAFPTEPSLPTRAPSPTPTATPDPILSLPSHVQEALSWEIELFDDFSDDSGSWNTGEFSNDNFIIKREIVDGQYLMTNQQLQGSGMQMFGGFSKLMMLGDFQTSFKARLFEGYADTGYGLSFRDSLQGSYLFIVRGNSYYLSSEYRQESDSQTNVLVDWTTSAALLPDAMNEFSVIANGNRITLLINGEIVADIVDDTHAFGTMSLLNGVPVTNAQATVAFDDFMLKSRATTRFKEASNWPLDQQNLFVSFEEGWEMGSLASDFYDRNISLMSGEYQVEATAKQNFYQVFFPEGMDPLGTAYVSVDITLGDNPDQSFSSLVIGQDDGNFLTFSYVFDEIASTFDASLFYAGEWFRLIPRYINADFEVDQELRLGAIISGEQVVLLINDVIYAEIKDSRLVPERAGIGIGLSEPGDQGIWTFTNFTLSKPAADESAFESQQPTATAEPQLTATVEQQQPTATDAAWPVGERSVNPKDGAILVSVPAGEFLMGYEGSEADEDEGPEHLVYLDDYWLYQTPVTNGQYRLCILDGSCSGTLSRFPDDTYPVVRVDWFQAEAYCEWAGGRLPTEAEWEKGARGTDGRLFPWGAQTPSCLLANYQGCFGTQFTQVGQFPEGISPYGALDMLGTVWEWVSDWYQDDYYTYSPYENPIGPSEGEFRVQRGHSFESNIVYLRLTDRARAKPSNEDYRKGFRCVFPDQP